MAGKGDARSSAELAVKHDSWSKVCGQAARRLRPTVRRWRWIMREGDGALLTSVDDATGPCPKNALWTRELCGSDAGGGCGGSWWARWLNQSGWFALLQRPYFRDAVQLRRLLVHQESPFSITARNAVNRARAAMRRRPETAEGARIKFWIAKAMLEDCLQILFPARSPGTL